MKISVNKQGKEVPEKVNLISLLEHLNITDKSSVAIAVNQQVIPRQKWDEKIIEEHDEVLLITAYEGG
ncbi:MAG: sulfur carrier protein ThiS [Bacteroidales bacterium]